MKPSKCLVTLADSGDILSLCLLEYENAFWVVTEWIGRPDEEFVFPARIIRVDVEPINFAGHQYRLTRPIPTAVALGETTEGYEFLDSPIHLRVSRQDMIG